MRKKVLFDKKNESRPYLTVNAVTTKVESGVEYILLGQRKNVAGAGFWYVTGGHYR